MAGVRYYGFYSNKSRGMGKKAANTEDVPALIHTEQGHKQFRQDWARLIHPVKSLKGAAKPHFTG